MPLGVVELSCKLIYTEYKNGISRLVNLTELHTDFNLKIMKNLIPL